MASKKGEISPSIIVSTNTEWIDILSKPSLLCKFKSTPLKVLDVFSKWAGPCDALSTVFKKLKNELGEKILLVQVYGIVLGDKVNIDNIEDLKEYRGTSLPQILIYIRHNKLAYIKGANGPLIDKTVKEKLANEEKGLEQISIGTSAIGSSAPVPAEIKSEEVLEQTLCLIKPDAMPLSKREWLLASLKKHKFVIVSYKQIWLTLDQAREFYEEIGGNFVTPQLYHFLSCGPVLALILAKENAVAGLHDLAGPSNPNRAKDDAPNSIRAEFGTDIIMNAIFCPETKQSAEKYIDFIFKQDSPILSYPIDLAEKTSMSPQKTLIVIKPEAAGSATLERIIQTFIWNGFKIVKRETLVLSTDQATQLYSKQKLKETDFYEQLITHMTSDPIVCLLIIGNDIFKRLKMIVGPHIYEQAVKSYPMSLRALYGTNTLKNAIDICNDSEQQMAQIQLIFPGVLNSTNSQENLLSVDHSMSRNVSRRGSLIYEPIKPKILEKTPENQVVIERTLAVIKPDAYSKGSKDLIISKMKAESFSIIETKELTLTLNQAQEFYKEHQGKPFYEKLTTWMSSAPIYAIVLEKKNAIQDWRKLAGPTDPNKAKETDPSSVRAIYGTDTTYNAVHGSDSADSAKREIGILFSETIVAIIKPDAYGSGKKDTIINRIKNDGFNILDQKESILSLEKSKELFIDFKDKPYYEAMTTWMSSEPIYSLVLEKGLAIYDWKKLAGPLDPEEAKKYAPNSLRAIYGTNSAYNAVRASHTVADGVRDRDILFPPPPPPPVEEEPISEEIISNKLDSQNDLKKNNSSMGSRALKSNSVRGSLSNISKSNTRLSELPSTSKGNLKSSKSNLNEVKAPSRSNLSEQKIPNRAASISDPKTGSTTGLAIKKSQTSKLNLSNSKPASVIGSKTNLDQKAQSVKSSKVDLSQIGKETSKTDLASKSSKVDLASVKPSQTNLSAKVSQAELGDSALNASKTDMATKSTDSIKKSDTAIDAE